jgi:hypothetical protein
MPAKFLAFFILFSLTTSAWCEDLFLRDNLRRAKVGDYIVTSQNKNYTLLHIYDKTDHSLTIEEITAPAQRIPKSFSSWKDWVAQKAPGNTSWVMFKLDISKGQIVNYFSLTKNAWFDLSQSNIFLTTLLNLKFNRVPVENRRLLGMAARVNSPENEAFWQPRMIFNGNEVPGVTFEAWQTRWPADGSDLSGKTIEVFIPRENDCYPSYFPYWLQIKGMIGNAKIRIIDAGNHMLSPAPPQPK